MTHFARFFKCFRRPGLCPFGNNNNSNKIFIGTVLRAFVLHYLLILWYLSKTDIIVPFSDELTDDQADKRNSHKTDGGLGLLGLFFKSVSVHSGLVLFVCLFQYKKLSI